MNYSKLLSYFILSASLVFGIGGCALQTSSQKIDHQVLDHVSIDTDSISLLEPRYAHGAVSDGRQIYVLGGSARGLSGDIQIIDPVHNQVTVLKDKLIPRRYFSAVFDGNESAFVLGGVSRRGKHAVLNPIIEVFNVRTGNVSRIGRMPIPTRTNTSVIHDNKIYVLGGDVFIDGGMQSTANLFVFDLATQTWTQLANMPTAKSTKAVVHQGYIYVVGGYNNIESMNVFERYNIAEDQWEVLPSLPVSISANSVTVMENTLISFGNYDDLAATYAYDFDTQQWQKVDLGYLPSRHNTATVLDNTVYVIGGTTKPSHGELNLVQQVRFN